MSKNRYCLKKDENCDMYLIPLSQEELFENVHSDALEDGDFNKFEKLFGLKRISGIDNLSFTEPCNASGDSLE